LQDHHGGDFINVVTPLAPIKTHFFEMLFGGKTGQAFVPEDNRKVESVPKLLGEFCNLFTLQAFLATHMEWVADDDLVDLVLFGEPSKNRDIGLKILSMQGGTGLSRKQQGITDCHAYLFFTYIESHHTHIMNVLLSFWRSY